MHTAIAPALAIWLIKNAGNHQKPAICLVGITHRCPTVPPAQLHQLIKLIARLKDITGAILPLPALPVIHILPAGAVVHPARRCRRLAK